VGGSHCSRDEGSGQIVVRVLRIDAVQIRDHIPAGHASVVAWSRYSSAKWPYGWWARGSIINLRERNNEK